MKKFLIIKNNRVVSIKVAFSEGHLILLDNEFAVEITNDKTKYKIGQKYKSLWGRIWGT